MMNIQKASVLILLAYNFFSYAMQPLTVNPQLLTIDPEKESKPLKINLIPLLRFKCSACHLTSNHRHQIEEHVRIESLENPEVYMIEQMANGQAFIKPEGIGKKFTCIPCKKTFATYERYHTHRSTTFLHMSKSGLMQKFNFEKPKSAYCKICDIYLNKVYLSRHKKTQTHLRQLKSKGKEGTNEEDEEIEIKQH